MLDQMPTVGMLRAGWSRPKVNDFYAVNALKLHTAGVVFSPYKPADKHEVEALVSSTIADSEDFAIISGEMGGIVARDRGDLVATLMLTVAEFDGALLVTIRDLATSPQHRGRGLGTVMLGLIWQITHDGFGRLPDATAGNCSLETARFYQRAGFTVLQPGIIMPASATLPVPLGIPPESAHPHLIVRPW